MKVRRIDPARSRIVLVGIDSYGDASIPDEPAIANNITDLVTLFTDPALGGFAPEHVLAAPAGAGAGQIGDLLVQAADEAEDTLLFYYAGHGFPTPRRAELYLSLAGTRTDRLAFTALPFDAVRDAFLDSRAGSRVVILDCCYSGKAIGRTLGDADVMEQLDVAGTYTLTASPATRPARAALPGERHTAFTGRLLELLHTGSPHSGPDLSLGDVYRLLRVRLRADGLPEPQQRGTATGDLLALTPNPGYALAPALTKDPPGPNAAPKKVTSTEESQPADITPLDAAERLAMSITDKKTKALALAEVTAATTEPERSDRLLRETIVAASGVNVRGPRAQSLVEVAQALATSHPDWARRHLRDAEAAARAMPGKRWDDWGRAKAKALGEVAKAVAATDPDRAVRIARGIRDKFARAEALGSIARSLAPTDPAKARKVASTVLDEWAKTSALIEIARATATTHPDRAEKIARGITPPDERTRVLVGIATVVVTTGQARAARLLDEAETIANTIQDERPKRRALIGIATAVATTHPARAARLLDDAKTIASKIPDAESRARALTEIATAVAATHPDQAAHLLDEAEAIASDITDNLSKADALITVARGVAATDSPRATRLLLQAETTARTIIQYPVKAQKLVEVAQAMAATDPARAERLLREADTITPLSGDKNRRAVAVAMAATDLPRATAMATSITHKGEMTRALRGIVNVVADTATDATLLREAERTASYITSEPDRSQAQGKIVKAWLRLSS